MGPGEVMTSLIRRLIVAAVATSVMGALQPRFHLQLNRLQPTQPQTGAQQQSWMISAYDLSQNQELGQIESHLSSIDTSSQETNRNLVLMERELSDMQGANRVWFWLLGGIVTAIGVAFWRSTGPKGKQ